MRLKCFSVSFVLLMAFFVSCSESSEPEAVASKLPEPDFGAPAIVDDDAPALARLGSYDIGVTVREVTLTDQPDLTRFNMLTRKAPNHDRRLRVQIFYPATVDAKQDRAVYQGYYSPEQVRKVKGLPATFAVQGIAFREAPPLTDEDFPLILVSHGFGNTAGALAGLTENIASKGYVVAVIEHEDMLPADDRSFLKLFPAAMVNRGLDQRAVLQAFLEESHDVSADLPIDRERVGLIGYSLGGFGALNTAGAGYDPKGTGYGWVGGGYLGPQAEGAPRSLDDTLDAVVALAPWGGDPAVGLFSDTALSEIKAPLLVVSGDQDDISNYADGVRRIFEETRSTDRWMLVFENAMHNIIQVGAPKEAYRSVAVWEAFEDPTWRKEKLLSVNAHFITAFLDWKVKGNDSRSAYFFPPTVRSSDGVWEQPTGQYYGDQYAIGEGRSEGYWLGFKRRQALGLQLHHLPSGSAVEESLD